MSKSTSCKFVGTKRGGFLFPNDHTGITGHTKPTKKYGCFVKNNLPPNLIHLGGGGILSLNAATKAKVSMSHLAATKLTEAMVGMEAGGGGN